MEEIYVGVDLHKTQFTICILINEEVLDQGQKYPMNDKGYHEFASYMKDLSQLRGMGVSIAIESTANARFFRDLMVKEGFRVTVVNTLRFKVVNLSTKKTDKNDARTLAEFLSKGMLPESYLCSAKSEGLRRVLKSRALMVQNSVALKNQVHAVLLAYGKITKTAQFQSKASRKRLLESLPPEIKDVVGVIFGTLETVEQQKKDLEKRLREITSDDENVRLLMTIPGIGVVNACTIRAYIDDIGRFQSFKQFSAYCGLVPWVQASNETYKIGRITKHGPPELRTAIIESVIAMVRMEEKTGKYVLMEQYKQMKAEKSSGKAIVATARKLSRIIYVMLTSKTAFNPKMLINRLEKSVV